MVTRHGFPLCVPLDVLLQPIPWSVDWSSRLDFSSCGAQGRNRVEVHLVIFVMRLPHRSLENYTETYVLSSLPILLGNPLHCWLRMLDVDTKISNISYVGCLIVRQLDSWIPNSYIYIYIYIISISFAEIPSLFVSRFWKFMNFHIPNPPKSSPFSIETMADSNSQRSLAAWRAWMEGINMNFFGK